MFSDDELMSYFKIHLKYPGDIKYRDQQKILENAPKEISEWPRTTILHFSMSVASRGYQAMEYMQSPQAWEYQSDLLHRPQSCGYQAEELMQRLKIGLNSNEIALLPSCSSFPTLKGKLRNRQSWGEKRPKDHAEQLLMEKLYVYFSFFANKIETSGQELNVRLQLTQNYSPCEDCAAKIEEFKNICRRRYHCDVDISIKLATFYKFYKFHSKNGLVNLQKAGVKLYLVDDNFRENIQNLLIEVYNIHEETMKTWINERKLWDELYMNKINNECNEIQSPFVWIVIIAIIICLFFKIFT